MKTNTQVPKFYAWNTVTGQYYSRATQAFTAPGQFSYCELDAQQLAVVRATFRNVESCPCSNPTPEPDAPAKPVTVVPQVEYNALCAVAKCAQSRKSASTKDYRERYTALEDQALAILDTIRNGGAN